MRSLDFVIRAGSILMLGIILSMMIFVDSIFVSNHHIDASIDSLFNSAIEDRQMVLLLERERSAIRMFWMQPGESSRRQVESAFAFTQMFENEKGLDPNTDPFLTKKVWPQQKRYLADSRLFMRLAEQASSSRARDIERTILEPGYGQLIAILGKEERAKFQRATLFKKQYELWQSALPIVFSAASIFTLLIVGGLLRVLRVYKDRAAKAVQDQIDQLEAAALTDNLTKLGNHRAFYEDFPTETARARRHNRALTLALIDIDDFKAINDMNGHQHGDKIIALFGSALKRMRIDDRAYRIGGDEIAIILAESNSIEAAAALDRLQDDVCRTLLGATISIGFAQLEVVELDEDLYERADAALYEAKRRGRNTMVDFNEIRKTAAVVMPRVAATVRDLLDNALIDVAFQPIWDIRSGCVLGFEALARPAIRLGLKGPQEAFDIAERIHKLVELDTLCISKIFAAAKNLPKATLLFINMSPETLERPNFDIGHLNAMIQDAGLSPNQIVVEFTERRISDPETLVQRAKQLRGSGMQVALDDTGSGHAGLEILSKLPLDFVKIDRELLLKAYSEKAARGVLAGIIAIARETGSYLIAEGIENAELMEFIRETHDPGPSGDHGIRGAQGFLLGRPQIGEPNMVDFDQFVACLRSRNSGCGLKRRISVRRRPVYQYPKRPERHEDYRE